jgi:hypothetical protein
MFRSHRRLIFKKVDNVTKNFSACEAQAALIGGAA